MKIKSFAKINLFLKITGKRDDGYHNLFSLICPVDLHDTISISNNNNGIEVFCRHKDVPEGSLNIAYKAAALFFKTLGIKGNLKVNIEKKIPVAAGLGGGSSNAAAVLCWLNQKYDYPFTHKKLMEMGLFIGADVPFFIFGKPAFATGIGEKLKKCLNIKPYYSVLINQNILVSTSDVYNNFNLGLTKSKKKIIKDTFDKGKLITAFNLYNDLESVTISDYRQIGFAKNILLQYGAEGVLMSGSGPTVFGLFNKIHEAESACMNIKKKYDWKVFTTSLMVLGYK